MINSLVKISFGPSGTLESPCGSWHQLKSVEYLKSTNYKMLRVCLGEDGHLTDCPGDLGLQIGVDESRPICPTLLTYTKIIDLRFGFLC